MLVAQSCLTLCGPIDCSLPSSSVHGILQVRILEWVAIPFSRGSSHPRYQTQASCIAGRFFTIWAAREDGRRGRKKNTETQRGEVTYPRSDSKSKKSYPRQGLLLTPQAGSTTDSPGRVYYQLPRQGLLLLLGWLSPGFLDPPHFKSISL